MPVISHGPATLSALAPAALTAMGAASASVRKIACMVRIAFCLVDWT
jgi:hypothetical protein